VTAGPRSPVVELEAIELRQPRSTSSPGSRIDLTIWPGELITLTGAARSGRSALLSVLGLLDRPAGGRYLLNGADTSRLKDKEASALRGRLIGLVFQRKMLLPSRSVLDNVMLPLRYAGQRGPRRLAIALDCLERAGLADRAALMTWQLSAGELALCAIARALVTGPGLLLCDQPAAGVEQEAAARIGGLFAALAREGRTVIAATDDQFTAAYSSRSVPLGRPASGMRALTACIAAIEAPAITTAPASTTPAREAAGLDD
jgi:putative ABC transport system ATP-binding protein